MWIHSPPKVNFKKAVLRAIEAKIPLSPLDERGRYLHWDDLRHRPAPDGFQTVEEYWAQLQLARRGAERPLPFTDTAGVNFWHCPTALEKSVFILDRQAAGNLGLPTAESADQGDRERYMINGLMDEAIHSSQLEGADTTYAHAKAMLRDDRSPTNHGERMIFNNYLAMRRIVNEFQNQPLSPEMILELHSILTDGTLKKPADQGRIRNCDADDADDFGVYDRTRGDIVHRPPPWAELAGRINLLCDFANEKPDEPFVHPAVRAMVLHFMLAYDHPFVDGNGRTARGLFYWAMARGGYWLTRYAPISSVIKRGGRAYARAFLLSEKSEGDLTYFLAYHLEVALKALQQLNSHVESREAEIRRAEKRLAKSRIVGNWNHRQLALLGRALRKPDSEYTYASHRNSHGVARHTAIADLNGLLNAGLLEKHRRGKRFVFFPAENLRVRLG